MASKYEWVVRVSSYMDGIDRPFTRMEITCDTRNQARAIMAAQKTLVPYAILRTQVDLFKVKTVIMADFSETRFMTKAR